jgi:hypothetical protein
MAVKKEFFILEEPFHPFLPELFKIYCMKRKLFPVILLFCSCDLCAQNVAINTDGSAPTDTRAMLEIKKSLYSKLKVRSLNYNDTSVLELSNRDAGGLGTDFLITARREEGLYLTLRVIPTILLSAFLPTGK